MVFTACLGVLKSSLKFFHREALRMGCELIFMGGYYSSTTNFVRSKTHKVAAPCNLGKMILRFPSNARPLTNSK